MDSKYVEVNGFLLEEKNQVAVLNELSKDIYSFLNQESLFKTGKFLLSDNIWDLRKFTSKSSRPASLLYDFNKVAVSFQSFLKVVVYRNLFERTLKPVTVKDAYFNRVVKFCTYLDSKGINRPGIITKNIVEKYMDQFKDLGEGSKLIERRALMHFFKELENYSVSLDFKGIYKCLRTNDITLLKLEREQGKTSLIPKKFYEKMLEIALGEIRNPILATEYQEQAAVVLLLSQLGCRIGEFRLLEMNKKEIILLDSSKEKSVILHLQTYKTVKSHEFVWTKAFLTAEGEEAYDFLCKLAIENKNKNYLFVISRGGNLYNEQKFRGLIFKFVVRNYKTLKQYINTFEDLSKIIISEVNKNKTHCYLRKEYLETIEDDVIYYPLPHQFRVNVVNELYRKGIHLDWIRIHMNHLSSDMTLHYLREAEEKEKSVIKIKEFIQDSISEDNDIEVDILYKKIDRFLSINQYNISIDFDALIKLIKGKKPIREKSLGFCVKSGFGRACPQNLKIDITERTDTHIPSCEFLNLTYNRFKKMLKVIQYNTEHGFINEKERETKRLQLLIKNYLSPEIKELEAELNTKGLDETKRLYSHLKQIIDNLERIKLEVKKCL